MEGIVNKIKMLSDLRGGPLSIDSLQKILGSAQKAAPSIADIQKEAAKFFKMPVEEMLSLSRKKHVIVARAAAIYLIKERLGKSLNDIGRAFRGKDHSTVLNSLKRARMMQESCPDFQNALKSLSQILF